jgi:hypothetical protein
VGQVVGSVGDVQVRTPGADLSSGASRQGNPVSEVELEEYGADLVVAVRPLSKHVKTQVDFGWRKEVQNP